MRLNASEVAKVLPTDTSYITILRDPAELFESSFHYFGRLVPFTWKIPGDDKMAEFLLNPQSYFDPEGFNSFYLKNLLFFDFGQDNTLKLDDPRVDEGISFISERFQLVMLVEYFEESLILLKEALCWEMEDLLFFKLNARKGSTVSKLTPELRARALEWNAIDWKLYQHFNQTFWKKVDAYGLERMAKDVAELRKRNKEMASICIEGGQAVDAGSIQETDLQPWQPIGEKSIMGYNLKKNIDNVHHKLCRKMLMPEIQYLTEFGVNLWITKLWGRVRDIINLWRDISEGEKYFLKYCIKLKQLQSSEYSRRTENHISFHLVERHKFSCVMSNTPERKGVDLTTFKLSIIYNEFI